MQRVAVDYQLTPLDKEQTGGYIRHRLRLAGVARICSPVMHATPCLLPAAAFHA
jgi:type II secretory pathway predicted ATPase ExeA